MKDDPFGCPADSTNRTVESGPTESNSWIDPRCAYVHVPFCAHRCGYCDFAAVAGADHLADDYLDALHLEIDRSLTCRPVLETVFVGGGTPTRLTAEQLNRLCTILLGSFRLAESYEWTIEANPGTLDPEKVDVLKSHGVTRVSLGAQSFDSTSLTALERNHDPADVFRSVRELSSAELAWSLDLIFAAPGSSLTSWNRDLDTVLGLAPNHLSCYGLVYEKGTELWKKLQACRVTPVDEDVEAEMYETTIERLAGAGLSQYEISNYAVPGSECRHNMAYWANDAYFGFGLGAARYVDGERSMNIRDLPGYIRRIREGDDVTGPRERLNDRERASETAALMIRRTRIGIDRLDFRRRTGFAVDELFGKAIRKHTSAGLLIDDGRSIRLSQRGIMYGDTVAADFTV